LPRGDEVISPHRGKERNLEGNQLLVEKEKGVEITSKKATHPGIVARR